VSEFYLLLHLTRPPSDYKAAQNVGQTVALLRLNLE